MRLVLLVGGLLAGGIVAAQQSPSYRLEEHVLNAGGHPAGGIVLGSPSYLIRLDAIGEAASGAMPASTSYVIDGGFVGGYRPPGEVRELQFLTKTALKWQPERSTGVYNLYRSLVSALPADYGTCTQSELGTNYAIDAATPAVGASLLYIVTAENRLGEEGTKGYRSSGDERPNPAPCP